MKRRLLAILLSLTLMLSLVPTAWAAETESGNQPISQSDGAQPTEENDVDVKVENPYEDVTVNSAVLADGVLTVKVSYAGEHQMAGIGYTYSLNGEEVADRAITNQVDGDGIPQTDKSNINGYVRDCTVYTAAVPVGAESVKITVDGLTSWAYDQETKTLTISGSGSMADFKYTTIDDAKGNVDEQGLMSFPWAEYKNEVKKVVVEDGITRLGNQAFRKFFALEELSVKSDDLTEIGSTICMNDSALKMVDLSKAEKLTVVGAGAFTGMTADAHITIKMKRPTSGLWVGSVNYVKNVTKFDYVEDNVVQVDNWECLIDGKECQIFAYTGNATNIVIPTTITAGENTYTVTSLDGGLFQNNAQIKSISFAADSKITAIPIRFVSCEGLRPSGNGSYESLILPGTIQTIGESAFASYSSNLSTLQFGNASDYVDLTGIKEIGKMGLSNLTTSKLSTKNVKISNELTSIGEQVFRNDFFSKLILTAGDYSGTRVDSNAFDMLHLTNGVELENGVTNADAIIDALLNASNATINKFTQLYENGESAVYTVDKSTKTVHLELSSGLNPENFQMTEWHRYSVSQSKTTTVGDWTVLTSNIGGVKTCEITAYTGQGGAIEIPAEINGYTVKSIGENVFKDNTAITTLTFASGSQCEEIGDSAFSASNSQISNLTKIEFPRSLKRIGKSAFFNCRKLTEIPAFPAGLITIDDGAFYNATDVKTDLLVIPSSMTKIGKQAFRWCSNIKSVQVNSNTISLGSQAFLLGQSNARNRYINMSAVENLTLGEPLNDDNVTLNINQGRDVSVIYVANDTIAAMLNDETNHPKTFDKGKTCIVSVNGGTVADSPTGLASVTRADIQRWELKWYKDSEYTTAASDTGSLTAGTTYYAKWAAKVDQYTVALIPDQTYTGEAITPAVTVLNGSGEAVSKDSYSVAYTNNTNVGTATATVSVDRQSVAVQFKIVKDTAPVVTMPGVSVTYGTEYSMAPVAVTKTGHKITNGMFTIRYYTDSACTKNETETSPVDAGTYYAKATLSETDNYAAASVVAKIVIQKATFEVVATGYSGSYDGEPHSITVTADGAQISYSKDNKTFGSTAPAFTNVGEYPVYYRAKKANHNDVNGVVTVSITKATPAISISADPATMSGSGTVKLTVRGVPNEGSVKVTCDDDITVTKNKDGTFSATLPNQTKTYTFTAKYTGATNYNNDNSAKCTVTVTHHSSGSSSSNPTYSVTTPSKSENGGVAVSSKNARKGDTVTVTVTPDAGYQLDKLTVTDKNGTVLKLTDKGDGKYSFTMPDGKVEVKAVFAKEVETSPFGDVSTDAYYYKAVQWAQEKGITDGISSDLFGPKQPCTRSQIVTFLWRAAGSPEPKGTTAGMTDVVPGSYYAKAVAWAVENGITTGTAEGTFSPDATCTRAQAVTFLARAQNAKATGKTAFSDVPADSYFADAVAWAQANGVTTGTSETTFSPDNDCTRAQIVTFLYRANQGT